MKGPSFVSTLVFGLGLLAVFIGERVIGAGTGRTVLTALGLGMVVLGAGLRLARWRASQGERAPVERAFLLLQGLGVLGLALYFLQSDLLAKLGRGPLSESAPDLALVVEALWPALVVASALPLFLMELAYGSMARAPQVEGGRVREAMYSGLGLTAATVFAFGAMYVVSERDAKWDFAYFRTTKPGEATKKVVQSLDEPVQVAAFFPPANEVREQVADYLDFLKKESPKLELGYFDHAVDVAKAKELGVSGNGVVVVSKGARREQLSIGTELEKARSTLRGLDQEFQKRLLQVARSRKTVYFTVGHGERSDSRGSADDQRFPVAELKNELRAQNYDVRNLSGAEGLGSQIPKDAAAVVVVGPTSPFMAAELQALKAYGEKGGRLLIALDPEAGQEFKELLEPLGLKFTPATLANDVAFARKSFQPSDRINIGTNSYSSHPAVTSIGRVAYPMYFLNAGWLSELPAHPAELSVDFAVRAHPSTWNDANGNYQFDAPAEARKGYELVAAVTRRSPGSPKPDEQMRALVLGDSDVLADELLGVSKGNLAFALDAMKWLIGDEALSGTVNTEQDVPLRRDQAWLSYMSYSTIFLVPAAVIGAGFFASRRRRSARKAAKQEAVQ